MIGRSRVVKLWHRFRCNLRCRLCIYFVTQRDLEDGGDAW